MPRLERNDATQSIHHVIQRGNNRNYIYEDTRDKREFTTLLADAVATYDATLLQYVLMDNHYHLLIKVGSRPLSPLLWFLNRNYTNYYNRRYNRIGTIYGGRYKSYPITDDRKLFSTIRYIVRNPVKAGMASTPATYRWSGHACALGGAEGIIDRPALLECFSPDAVNALKRYRECTEHESWSAQVGFATIIEGDGESTERLACLLDQFLAGQRMETHRTMVVSGARSTQARELRNTFIRLAVADGHALKDIAAFLNVSHETVRRTHMHGTSAWCSTDGTTK